MEVPRTRLPQHVQAKVATLGGERSNMETKTYLKREVELMNNTKLAVRMGARRRCLHAQLMPQMCEEQRLHPLADCGFFDHCRP